jgi:hypothetical protein
MRAALAAIRNFRLVVTCGLALLLMVSGCRMLDNAAKAPVRAVTVVTPGERPPPPPDPVEIQQALLRFADEFLARFSAGIDDLQRTTNRLPGAESLKWKIDIGTETCAIVSGPNALANLLDMTMFVTAARISASDHWRPKFFGDSDTALEDTLRQSETNVWRLAQEFLPPKQRVELEQVILEWLEQNPVAGSVQGARATRFASGLRDRKQSGGKSANLLGLLMLDPFSGLDPAAREVAQIRLFAERAMFVSVKMPHLLRWQSELLVIETTSLPAISQLVTNSTEVALAAQRFATLAENLPGQVAAEREAILKTLAEQETEVANLLSAGTKMSDSLNTTLHTFDDLMARFGVGETNSAAAAASDPNATPAEPFRIQDYGETAARLEAAARQLTELLANLNVSLSDSNVTRLSAQVRPVVQDATRGGKELVNHVFWRAAALLGLLLAAGLIYQRARPRGESGPPGKPAAPK